MNVPAVLMVFSYFVALPVLADVKPDPGDYAYHPPGTNFAILYQHNFQGEKLYSHGKKVGSNLGFEANLLAAKFVSFLPVAGTELVWAPQLAFSSGRQKVHGTEERYGFGDSLVGATLWLHADQNAGEYFSLSSYLTIPTGEHKNEGFAFSDNRYAADFQIAFLRKLSQRVSIDFISEIELYDNDRSTGARRDPLYQTHTHVTYNLNESSWLALSYRHSWGGEERLNGAEVSSSKSNGSVLISLAKSISPKVQFMAQVRHDTNITEGVKIDKALQFRLVYLY